MRTICTGANAWLVWMDGSKENEKTEKAEESKKQKAKAKEMRETREDAANEECPASQHVAKQREQVMALQRKWTEEQRESIAATIQEAHEFVCSDEG